MEISKAFDLFMTDQEAVGNSSYTRAWYRQYVGRMIRYFNDCALDSVGVDDLRRFLSSLWSGERKYQQHKYRKSLDGSLSHATVAGYVRAIKAFYNWLESNEHISFEQNVARRLKIPRLPKLEPKSITDGDLEKLIDAARVSPRDFALVLFLADTGCRVGGLSDFRLSDLKLSQRQALVTEKGMNTRTLFFGRQTASALRVWLNVRKSGTDFVFVTDDGKKLSYWGIRQILVRVKSRAGIKGRANPHSFRHRFARSYIKHGGDLATLADLMGHTDVLVTKRAYAIFQTQELQRKHDMHSPLKGIEQTTSRERKRKKSKSNKKTAKK